MIINNKAVRECDRRNWNLETKLYARGLKINRRTLVTSVMS